MASKQHKLLAGVNDLHIPYITNAGSPDSSVTAAQNHFCLDTTNTIVYRNTDGAQAWSVFAYAMNATLGTIEASKGVALDSNKKVDEWNVDNLKMDGNTLSSTDANGAVNITPNGSGAVVVSQKLTVSDLTAGRVPFASTAGLLVDDADFTFATDTLTVTKIGAFEAVGAINFGNQNMTNVDIDSGDITGVTISGALTWSAAQNLNSQALTNVNIDSGTVDGVTIGGASAGAITGTTITATSLVIGANTLTTTEWANLDGQDQAVASGSSPSFVDVTLSNDLLLATGSIINFNSGAETITHSANTITVGGVTTWDMGAVTTLDFGGATSITASGANLITITGTTAGVFLRNLVFVGQIGVPASNANMTDGITIGQLGGSGEALTFKSNLTTHGVTTQTETNTWGKVRIFNTDDGGIMMAGYCDAGNTGVLIQGTAPTDDTGKATTDNGNIILNATKTNGTGIQAVGADGNLVTIENNHTARFIFDAEGSGHADVEWVAFDEYNDVQVLSDIEALMLPDMFGQTVEYNLVALEKLGIVGKGSFGTNPNGKNHAMINWTKMSMLHHGAIQQVYAELQELKEENSQLKSQLTTLIGEA